MAAELRLGFALDRRVQLGLRRNKGHTSQTPLGVFLVATLGHGTEMLDFQVCRQLRTLRKRLAALRTLERLHLQVTDDVLAQGDFIGEVAVAKATPQLSRPVRE